MKASSKQKIVVTLELTEVEARWLRDVMENPLGGEPPKEEDPDQQYLRVGLFNELVEALGE